MIVLSVLLFILGAAVLVTGVLAVTAKLPGNRWVGLRIPEVRKNQEMWDTGHRIAGPTWTGAGVALIVAGVVGLQGGWLWAISGLLVVGALFLIGMGAALAAQTLAKIDHAKAQQAEQQRAAAGCCSSGSSSDSSCGGDCDGDCGGHDSVTPVELDLDAARRAAAARDAR
ncbi:Putative secreted protein [Corynebacterium glyciniphilum AJ 3170]|uniref:Putative secreted protein n=1 Tax=Corynebacterium glyciniphilum AJ 3170 TaxID=1404245 RepID=X5DQZ3_9CORY|nr:SdpI family protein [Corynebacterium glyciniphilum]AHW65633.1 Putative secreted protein [Corynebacterium glyciniphilum AJ 3170]